MRVPNHHTMGWQTRDINVLSWRHSQVGREQQEAGGGYQEYPCVVKHSEAIWRTPCHEVSSRVTVDSATPNCEGFVQLLLPTLGSPRPRGGSKCLTSLRWGSMCGIRLFGVSEWG